MTANSKDSYVLIGGGMAGVPEECPYCNVSFHEFAYLTHYAIEEHTGRKEFHTRFQHAYRQH